MCSIYGGFFDHVISMCVPTSVTRENYQMSIEVDFTRKMKIFNTFTKIAKECEDLHKLIVAKGFKKLPKVQ